MNRAEGVSTWVCKRGETYRMCTQCHHDLGQSHSPDIVQVGAVHQSVAGVEDVVFHHEEPHHAVDVRTVTLDRLVLQNIHVYLNLSKMYIKEKQRGKEYYSGLFILKTLELLKNCIRRD